MADPPPMTTGIGHTIVELAEADSVGVGGWWRAIRRSTSCVVIAGAGRPRRQQRRARERARSNSVEWTQYSSEITTVCEKELPTPKSKVSPEPSAVHMATCAAAPSQPSAAESEEAAARARVLGGRRGSARAGAGGGRGGARVPRPPSALRALRRPRCGRQVRLLRQAAEHSPQRGARVALGCREGSLRAHGRHCDRPRQHLMSCHVLVEHKEAPEAAG